VAVDAAPAGSYHRIVISFARRFAPAAVPALVTIVACATIAAAQTSGSKPAPWQPKPSSSETKSPGPRTFEAPEGVVRPIAPLYQPSVADSVLPYQILYRELAPETPGLTAAVGALRQGLPARTYHALAPKQPASVAVDGGNGGSHLAIVVLVPWIDRVTATISCPVDLDVRMDGGKEQTHTLWFVPGPMLTTTGRAPLAVSVPGLFTVPLPPGRHQVEFRFRNTPASYVLFQLGVPEVMPLPVMPEG
jgi:hypothetical protein